LRFLLAWRVLVTVEDVAAAAEDVIEDVIDVIDDDMDVVVNKQIVVVVTDENGHSCRGSENSHKWKFSGGCPPTYSGSIFIPTWRCKAALAARPTRCPL
jgi:hypothetical protein